MSAPKTAAVTAVVVVLALGVLGTALLVRPRPARTASTRLVRAEAARPLVVSFAGPDRVYTTEHDRGHEPLEATSGTLLVRDGTAWSGRPDDGPPDPARGTTHSAVLRVRTVRKDFADQRVRVRVRNDGLAVPKGRDPHDYDGVSLGLRSTSASDLYYVNVQRRDGKVTIKRKAAGRYDTLATADHPVAHGTWVTIEVTAKDVDAGVHLALVIDGRPVLDATDTTHPLRRPGRVLVRADNCDVRFDDLEVTPLAAG